MSLPNSIRHSSACDNLDRQAEPDDDEPMQN
jgi:hypothetical protein